MTPGDLHVVRLIGQDETCRPVAFQQSSENRRIGRITANDARGPSWNISPTLATAVAGVWLERPQLQPIGSFAKNDVIDFGRREPGDLMSGKGNCFDNAMVEMFFKTLKAELVWRTIFQSRIEAAIQSPYIDGFYNPVRRHSALDFISPLQFERRAA